MNDISRPLEELHPNERLKHNSEQLRGTLRESLADPVTGAVTDDDTQLTKFHGIYQQDDRDLRSERRKQKLEPFYQFMVRLRLPGGVCTTKQWLALDELARQYANGTLRLTTRQTFQFHGVLKRNLKAHIQGINATLLDTMAACGDVNRNVIATANPWRSPVHRQVYDFAHRISQHLRPRSRAYFEIFLDEKPVARSEPEEPNYGRTYLPRKFKIALAVPPDNDIDVFAHDLGFIAITEQDELLGFNISVGGGMGMSHGEPKTFPRLADVIGFCRVEQVLDVAEQVMCVQRDFGDRKDRGHARFKYTIEDRGLDWFRKELERRLGYALEAPRAFRFETTGDPYGWQKGTDGTWHFTLSVENGRVADHPDYPLMSGLREIAKVHKGDYALTTNQNLIIAGVSEAQKSNIQSLLEQYGMVGTRRQSALRRHAMACVALPTCGLAMAESERYLPSLIDKLDVIMHEAGLADDPIVVRMTGCPNGCARPYLAEIGFVGKALGKYNVYLGASFSGERMNRLFRENIGETEIIDSLAPLIRDYAQQRQEGERFGDFVIRVGAVKPMLAGRDFQQPTA
ncbi:assimilatory sulfite reductase (NADPH) hemoprotein subunit [Nitrococcus mobilis]|uniref:Sulfite reductase [NADPH] hemoprotein beta-component n=1 Tax=Nitrococcus mobilis Nb-231 TaxID=314278 RepID=A4BVP2_9GAMM|nr:assimilatory sulfite reductase (NADPH) hemoprotein subunit [Nitrococcus mobilis]EAR20224.1 sulfite reductase hemoprotein beta subunit [Nitrococcus mobilis Nb-231]